MKYNENLFYPYAIFVAVFEADRQFRATAEDPTVERVESKLRLTFDSPLTMGLHDDSKSSFYERGS